MLDNRELTISTLLKAFPWRVSFTWVMTLGENDLMALIPLFNGFAKDGLMSNYFKALIHLGLLFAVLVGLAVLRRIYDTRVYSMIRVEFGKAQTQRGSALPVSRLNAQIGMGRELVEFLEETLPMVMTGLTQLIISVIILFAFSPLLAVAAGLAAIGSLAIYSLFHHRFYRLNGDLNQQMEKQVNVLNQRSLRPAISHFLRLRRAEIRISDSEAILYGLIFVLLLALILFNIWYATTALVATTGAIFSIISYSWDFVDGTIALPATLQHWTRLSEIMKRINTLETNADQTNSMPT